MLGRRGISAGFFAAVSAQDFEFKVEKNGCGVCKEMYDLGLSCDFFGACDVVNTSVLENSCSALCPVPLPPRDTSDDTLEVRVVKGFGTKAYDQVRISVISGSSTPPVEDFFDYSAPFAYRWTDNNLHTAMKTAVPGESITFNVGSEITVKLPKQGAGTAGVLIADPCLGHGSWVGMIACLYARKFKTNDRVVGLINTFVADEATDFWGIFGDNFYDRTGKVTADVFGRISLDAKSKLFMTVPGNHDYWVLGSPTVSTRLDQCAHAHMQYYAQDAKAAEHVGAGSSAAPFDLSVNPSQGHILGCNLPPLENAFWYNQVGNVGMVGQSGAYSLEETKPFMEEACAWLGNQSGLEVAVLIGHWDAGGLGAKKEMDMPHWYTEMAALPGCSELDARGMLKFVMGHTHCNDPHPHGKIDTGFRVAGFGMEGCGNFGMPIVDTTEGRVRFWYFDTSSDDLYDQVTNCVQAQGWRQCTDLATLWLDQPIATQEATQIVA